MTAILGYARVSTDDQDLAGQRLRLEAAGASQVYEDKVTGKRMDRPGLGALLAYARAGDTLTVVRLDRLGRSMRELLDLIDELRRRGIAFRSLEEHIDTSSAAGELILHVFASIAQFERRLIGDRTRDALAARRAGGGKLGRLPVPPERIEALCALVDAGRKPADAAEALGIGRSTAYRELKDRRPVPVPGDDVGVAEPKLEKRSGRAQQTARPPRASRRPSMPA